MTSLPSRPMFAASIHVEHVEGKGIIVLTERAPEIFGGDAFEVLAQRVDGVRSLDDILAGAATPEERDDLIAAMTTLVTAGYLRPGSGEAGPDGSPAAEFAEVSLEAVGTADAAGLAGELEALGVPVTKGAGLLVVVVDDYLRKGLSDLNEEALRSGRRWMLVKPSGPQVWAGPVFRAETTGCWECLAHRVRHNRPLEVWVQKRRGHEAPVGRPAPPDPSSERLALAVLASAVARQAGYPEHLDLSGKVLSVDCGLLTSRLHTLVWRPQCPACGVPEASRDLPPRPVALAPARKTFTIDGGHRVVAPEVTLQRYWHHVSPITGVVAEIESLVHAGGAPPVHVYRSGADVATARAMAWAGIGTGNLSAGKGATDAQARASALCEGLERYSANFHGEEYRQWGRLDRLGEQAIHPNDCMRFSSRQFERRELTNSKAVESYRTYVPKPFDPTAEVEWSPLWSLTRGEPRLLPTAWCYMGYPTPPGELTSIACSNGAAAGNTLEEAVLQGFFELVERDSVAMWWYNRAQRPELDLDSFDEPYVAELRAYLEAHGRDLWALDLTADLGVPVFAALSRSTDGDGDNVQIGFGAHFDARIAMLRAVTELNQKLPGLLARQTPQTPQAHQHPGHAGHTPREILEVADQPYLAPATGRSVASQFDRELAGDVRDDVVACQALVEAKGMELLVLDQTRPDVGLPVVKVVVPGMRHFWPRFAPGRLYDVPVALGWRAEPCPEADLNPIPPPP